MFNLQKKLIFLFIISLSLCSCASMLNKESYCPALSVVPDGATVTRYEQNSNKILSKSVINHELGYCKVDENNNLNISGNFYIQTGLSQEYNEKTNIPLKYFIALLDEENKVLLKKDYFFESQLKAGKTFSDDFIKFNEEVKIKNKENLKDYNILLSFQLTEKELSENREQQIPYYKK